MKSLFFQPVFATGLLLRIILIFLIAPTAISNWYSPFLELSITPVTLDPWTEWLTVGGAPTAFPYGYAMWIVFIPLTALAKLLNLPVSIGYSSTLLLLDIALLILLRKQWPQKKLLSLYAYWLSPIVILASYVLGLNDLLPALLLTLSLIFIQAYRFQAAGFITAAAISAKLSMVVALPFVLIYLIHNRGIRIYLRNYLTGLGSGAILLWLPFFLSNSGISMITGNPEMNKVYQFTINVSKDGQLAVLAVPLLYLLMLYHTWRIRRLNFELFHSMTGLSFLLLVLLTPASPGWFVWCLPFLVLYQFNGGLLTYALTTIFSLLYTLTTLIGTPLHLYNGKIIDFYSLLNTHPDARQFIQSLILTGMIGTGIVLAIRIWRETVKHNDFFRLSRKPFVIGIAGDSGAGKDTYASAIAGLFGMHSVAQLSGDDYHLWDRQKPMWQVMTHLNPTANDLEGFCNDLIALSDGRHVHTRHYNHQTGKMSKPFKLESNDFIIASGLHTLYLPLLRDCLDLKVYLDIDEGLRKHFKMQRDIAQRGHTFEHVMSVFERREPDSIRFIRPQAAHADLILKLLPIHASLLNALNTTTPRLRLEVRTRHGFNEQSLTRVLVGVCGLHVDLITSANGDEVTLSIEGESSAEDVSMAAAILCKRVIQFLDISPEWKSGVTGLMQLVTLTHIDQALTKRIL
jgi:uridine kinase